jgi:hypothetical protein
MPKKRQKINREMPDAARWEAEHGDAGCMSDDEAFSI